MMVRISVMTCADDVRDERVLSACDVLAAAYLVSNNASIVVSLASHNLGVLQHDPKVCCQEQDMQVRE